MASSDVEAVVSVRALLVRGRMSGQISVLRQCAREENRAPRPLGAFAGIPVCVCELEHVFWFVEELAACPNYC